MVFIIGNYVSDNVLLKFKRFLALDFIKLDWLGIILPIITHLHFVFILKNSQTQLGQ